MPDLTPDEQLYAGLQMTRPLLRNITTRVEADLAGTGISVGQRAILEVLLSCEQASAPQITKQLQVARQFVGRELKALARDGLVDTQANPQHRSAFVYSLTARSRRVIEGIRAKETARIKAFSTRFTTDEIAAFYKIQSAMNEEFARPSPAAKQ